MPLVMWTYDLAREQSPSLENLRSICRLSLDSGYNALGLYIEHRFRYPSAPWAAGKGAVDADMVRTLEREFPNLQIVPFINLLGHFEGFLYSEGGQVYAEERLAGMQACPSKPEFVELARNLLKDTINAFSSHLIHIGGDETQQLGRCPMCRARVEAWEREEGSDGKGRLYAEHFGPLAQEVIQSGRRPALWGDMLLEHPQAMASIPKEALIFDWQYFGGARDSSTKLKQAGFEVVLCPTLLVYCAPWLHLLESEQNVRQIARDAKELGAHGFCLTTWEAGLFGAYDTLFPAIRASAGIASKPPIAGAPVKAQDKTLAQDFDATESAFLRAYSTESERFEVWARLMGIDLNGALPSFEFTGIRSSLKVRLLLQSNPFLSWIHHSEEFCGEAGTRALEILEQAIKAAPNDATKGVSLFIRMGIEFVRIAEAARKEYAVGKTEGAIAKLSLSRQIFDDLAKIARASAERIGGSLADLERCRVAKEHVERVIVRLRKYGDGSLGYRPSFEHLSHPKFVPHDQAAWWLVNDWANE